MQIKGKEVDLILDDYTKNTDPELTGYWTQLCTKHAHLVDSDKLDNAGSGKCGVQGCWEDAEYYYDFDEEDIR